MTDKNKTFKVDMDFDELVERVAQTDSKEVTQVSQDKILQNLNNFILEEKIIQKPKQRNNATSA